MDTDFKMLDVCMGRPRGWRRVWVDLVCRATGHLLWRTGCVRSNPTGSLDFNAVYCRRCFKGGYVDGDYARKQVQ